MQGEAVQDSTNARKGRPHPMLVLTRCPGQGNKATICIGPDVEITVLRIDGDLVQVAVHAPSSTVIAFDAEMPKVRVSRVDKPRRRPVY